MKLTWHGHSCFTLESSGYSIVTDPYADGSVTGLGKLRLTANEVRCSHEHGDHNAVQCVTLMPGPVSPFTITELHGWHDDCHGAKRGPNTMRIFDDGVVRIAHMGDLGCMPDEAALQALQGLDAVLIPVGGTYTVNAAQAKAVLDLIRPRVVIPMHYRGAGFGFPVLATVDAFTALYPATAVRREAGNTIEITPVAPAGVALLQL